MFEYRNKMEYSFGDDVKDGPLLLGMHERGSFYNIVKTDCCRLTDEDFNIIQRAEMCIRDRDMSVEQFGELFENPKIIGVKFTAADFFLLERMRKAYPDKLIFAGFDEMMLSLIHI